MHLKSAMLFFVWSHCLSLISTATSQSNSTQTEYLEIRSDLNESDRIVSLPRLTVEPSFRQYSGFLEGATPNIQLHYWLVEAVGNHSGAPLFLWLNGGPGCSSLFGHLYENGPFIVKPGPNLVRNPYSWNLLGNVLYLESPAGVGFSYAKDGNTSASDDTTSLHNYHALWHFLKKFPAYKNRAFYITGESYAGIYVPTLALRLLNDGIDLDLRGDEEECVETKTVCDDESLYTEWLNMPEVRVALHVDSYVPMNWTVCSDEVFDNYTYEYYDMSSHYKELLSMEVPIVMYAGDFDSVVNHLGVLWFVERLHLNITHDLRGWKYTDNDGKIQLGGFYQTFNSKDTLLRYATVRAAGHFVPTDQPAAVFHLLTRFVNGGDFS
ncbi:hypothetical protein P879_08439 [Paragonimus westermani]|uniref:Carboxypeptidase n=1 Tax=Paragonimus westermani TaxID=34504 RepID=A0A8T0DJQ5_9TREM|nr:hypothetical protein P879_08439 [Paragonimus westermani]